MLFNSLTYLLFLPFVVLSYWVAPQRFRLLLLLICSYVFYMSWRAEYGLLLLGLTTLNFFAGVFLQKLISQGKKRILFVAAITINLSILGLFKYTNFLITSYWSGVGFLQATQNVATTPSALELPIILPLGISFFVFEFIHYLSDIRLGKASAITCPLRFGLFAAFFPSQIAGPIKRFEDFDRQIQEEKKFDLTVFQSGIYLIIQGLFKKCALGDNLAQLATVGFVHCHSIGAVDAWSAVLAFTLQIYYDFSGYTDIGIGSAKLLGYKLPENFNMPYISKNMSEFWKRWHISLSTWLRDYLYIPLGGSRVGKLAQMRNLCLTMLLGGLWHGAAWTFILWGAFHGFGLVVAHSWESTAKRFSIFEKPQLLPLWDLLSWSLTMLFVMCGWVLFRAQNMDQAYGMFNAMVSTSKTSCYDFQILRMAIESTLPAAISLYTSYYWLQKFCHSYTALKYKGFAESESLWFSLPSPARVLFLIGTSAVILGFAPNCSVPFIYFQF